MIHLSEATFQIGNVNILNGISFSLSSKGFYCLVGANGSGKTTVLKLIMKIYEADTGTVDTIPTKDISYLPQNMQDPPFITVGEAIKIAITHGRQNETYHEQDLQSIAEQFRISHLLDREFSEVSIGEKQRAWLAFAIAQRKEIIIMDEPLSAVDRNSKEEFYEMIKGLSFDDKALLVVTHDVDMALIYADKIIAIEDGIVAFDGLANGYRDWLKESE